MLIPIFETFVLKYHNPYIDDVLLDTFALKGKFVNSPNNILFNSFNIKTNVKHKENNILLESFGFMPSGYPIDGKATVRPKEIKAKVIRMY